MWEVYKTGWGLVDWTYQDQAWDLVDRAVGAAPERQQGLYYTLWFFPAPGIEKAETHNRCATPLGRYERWAVTPDDLRLANCATIIKRAFRVASNDPVLSPYNKSLTSHPSSTIAVLGPHHVYAWPPH